MPAGCDRRPAERLRRRRRRERPLEPLPRPRREDVERFHDLRLPPSPFSPATTTIEPCQRRRRRSTSRGTPKRMY
jgi:hypothetical protein